MILMISHPDCVQYSQPGHPERPYRIEATVKYLKSDTQTAWSRMLQWKEADITECMDSDLLAAHRGSHLESVMAGGKGGAGFDADTPAYPGIDKHAKRAVAAAVMAMKSSLNGVSSTAMSLIRPPGHHATPQEAMGFCYFNSIAVAILKAQRELGAQRVAVLDFDVHHGNGTQDILIGRKDVSFFSLHQSPCYPGTGLRSEQNCANYPLPPRTDPADYRAAFSDALEKIKAFKPDLLGVSAGFDAFKEDPLSDQLLDLEDFEWFGKSITALGIPTFHVLEGGYSDRLPEVVGTYLKGISQSH